MTEEQADKMIMLLEGILCEMAALRREIDDHADLSQEPESILTVLRRIADK